MIWHIFKKDCKLTWPMAAGVALTHFILRLVLYQVGHFGRPGLHSLLNLLLIAGYLGSALVIASVVHQDAIPGMRQDWLVRPIRRRDLLLAKMLFVLLMVQAPMVAADTWEALLYGFPLSQSLAAALSRGIGLFPFFYLAMLTFASLTRSFTEAIVGGVMVFLGGAGLVMVVGSLNPQGHTQFWVEWSGLSWITQSERILVTVLAATVILSLQYFYRRTMSSRWIFGAGTLLWMMTYFTPWRPAFAVQELASPNPGSARPVTIAFAPDLGKSRSIAGLDPEERRGREDDMGTPVSLPLRVTGLPENAVLNVDHYEMRLIGTDGKPLGAGAGANLQIHHKGTPSRDAETYLSVHVPTEVYERMKDQLAHLEIDYSLTLMRLADVYGLPAINGDQRTPELGWCRTRVNDNQTAIQLRCIVPGNVSNCSATFVENVSTGQQNPERFDCEPSYWPYVGKLADSISRTGANLAFRDPTGLARYPVDGPQLRQARVVVRVYRPEDHFTRRVVATSVRLSEWSSR